MSEPTAFDALPAVTELPVAPPTAEVPMSVPAGAVMDAQLAALGALPVSEQAKLKALDAHIEQTVEDEFTEQEKAQESTKRQALSVITLSLFGIGAGMLGLLAFASVRADAALVASIADATQPSTLLIAVVSSLGGLAAGAGLGGGRSGS